MKKITMSFFAAGSLAALVSLPASAAPVEFIDNGHFYEVIIDPGITWDAAKTAAEGMTITVDGVDYDGHLAIITSAGEDNFIETLRLAAPSSGNPEFWVGAFQDPATSVEDANWQWIIPEAPFDNYTNWQNGEPNDAGGDEKFLGVGHSNEFGWNDERALGNIEGYIVEWDVNAFVFTAAELPQCLASGGTGCPVTINDAQILTIPDAAVGQNAELAATTYILTDDPNRCGQAPLVLFGGDLIISPNHCATPETGYRFAVVHTQASAIELQAGTVRVVQDAKALFPAFPYTCDDPILSGSPNDQEVVIYQRDNKEDMREYGETWGPFIDVGDEAGATGDITDSCGSSRGRRAENSYSVIAMVQRFDPGSEWDVNPDLNHQRWIELGRFKLLLMIEAVNASEDALSRRDFRQILRQAEQALFKFDQASWQRAVTHLNNMENKVLGANYDFSQTLNNDEGEQLERLGSIRFIIETKIEPFGAGN
ncbi:MAG: hypothetical protein ACR2QX_08165 [Woeseiaceae bacterium]